MHVYTPEAPETDDIGLANNDIDGFLKNLLASVCRECAQNSNDEACERPVQMSINRLTVPINELPGIDRYKEVVEGCLVEARDNDAAKAIEFFENAKNELNKEEISLLQIADARTQGAGDKFIKNGKFFTLVVSEGRTDKKNVYSAGSFGIGKNAAIAGSALRLVFYSSQYEEDGEPRFYCMGKSVLTSWRENDQNMSHKIFFDADPDSFSPVTNQEELPDWARKDELGLKVSIVAPRIELQEGWVAGYVASLLSNFFVAIYDEDIQFYIDHRQVDINRATMQSYFSRDDVKKAAEDAGILEQLSWAEMCSNALAAGEFNSEIINVSDLGDFEVLIRVGEGMPNRVFIVRNGMYITDTLKHFGKPLKRFPNTKDFVLIVRPKSIDAVSSTNIKRMENPEHNELTTGYIANPEEVSKLQNAVRNLEAKVREIIKKYAKMEALESREIEELKEFFPSQGDAESPPPGEEHDPTAVTSERLAGKSKHIGHTAGGKKGGKGKRGGKSKRGNGRKGPGGANGGQTKQIMLPCQAMRVADSAWRIQLEEVGSAGTIELWPQARSRGAETKSLKIKSCSLGEKTIAKDGLSVSFSAAENTPVELELEFHGDAPVVDFRPPLRGN